MTDSETSNSEVFTIPYGPHGRLCGQIRTLGSTPYLCIDDAQGRPILTLAVTGAGFTVHRGPATVDGARLGG